MELCPVVDAAPGQHLQEERGSREPTGCGGPSGGPSAKPPRASTHQRDLGPGARRGAVEGRARGGRWFAGQQRPQAGKGHERGGRRQPGSHQDPDSRHGRAGTAGSEGQAAEEFRAETDCACALSPVRPNSRSTPVGGAAPAQSPPPPASAPVGGAALAQSSCPVGESGIGWDRGGSGPASACRASGPRPCPGHSPRVSCKVQAPPSSRSDLHRAEP